MTCKHQFHKIREVQQPKSYYNAGTTTTTNPQIVASRWNDEYGVLVGCSLCGEIRTIWEDGQIKINHSPDGNIPNKTKK